MPLVRATPSGFSILLGSLGGPVRPCHLPVPSLSPLSPSTLLPWPGLARPPGHATLLVPSPQLARDTKDVLYAGESLHCHPAQTLQAFDNVL